MFCVEVSSPHAGIQVIPQRLQSLNRRQQLTFVLQSQIKENKPDIKKTKQKKTRNLMQAGVFFFCFCLLRQKVHLVYTKLFWVTY